MLRFFSTSYRLLPLLVASCLCNLVAAFADEGTAVIPDVAATVNASIASDEPNAAKDKLGRLILRDDRPENARGWVVVAKTTFWPLCYEALDHLERARELVSEQETVELANELDKSGAWLKLAASAAMTDGKAGIVQTGELLSEVSEQIRKGEWARSDEETQQLITLAEVCIAKSHVMRAKRSNKNYANEYAGEAKKASTQTTSKEILQGRQQANRAQFRYDLEQSSRHLRVAKTYLDAGAKAGHLKFPETVATELQPLPETGLEQIGPDEADALVPTDEYARFIEQERQRLAKIFAAQ